MLYRISQIETKLRRLETGEARKLATIRKKEQHLREVSETLPIFKAAKVQFSHSSALLNSSEGNEIA